VITVRLHVSEGAKGRALVELYRRKVITYCYTLVKGPKVALVRKAKGRLFETEAAFGYLLTCVSS